MLARQEYNWHHGAQVLLFQYFLLDNVPFPPPPHPHPQACTESITSIQGGVVGASGYDEIVAATYAGEIF